MLRSLLRELCNGCSPAITLHDVLMRRRLHVPDIRVRHTANWIVTDVSHDSEWNRFAMASAWWPWKRPFVSRIAESYTEAAWSGLVDLVIETDSKQYSFSRSCWILQAVAYLVFTSKVRNTFLYCDPHKRISLAIYSYESFVIRRLAQLCAHTGQFTKEGTLYFIKTILSW